MEEMSACGVRETPGWVVESQGRLSSGVYDWRMDMVALLALVLILAIFGGLGFAVHVLWYVLIAALLLWLIGFFIGGAAGGGSRRWYGR
jgi:hypothetical protein